MKHHPRFAGDRSAFRIYYGESYILKLPLTTTTTKNTIVTELNTEPTQKSTEPSLVNTASRHWPPQVCQQMSILLFFSSAPRYGLVVFLFGLHATRHRGGCQGRSPRAMSRIGLEPAAALKKRTRPIRL